MINDIAFDIEKIVDNIDNYIYGELNQGAHVYKTCNVKYARTRKPLHFINANGTPNQTMASYIENDNIHYLGDLPVVQPYANPFFWLQKPFFVSGTHISANREWSVFDKDLMVKTPLIWLLETTRVKKFGRESVYDYSGDVRIFFLDETNPAEYKTRDHLEQAVNPMHNLAQLFLDTLAKDIKFKPVDEFEIITFARFGVERQDGIFQNIIDANLSGVELRVNLTKYKENCKC